MSAAPTGSPNDAPIAALLPRDWPARLDALMPDATNRRVLLTLVKRQLDDWVLAALDAREASREDDPS